VRPAFTDTTPTHPPPCCRAGAGRAVFGTRRFTGSAATSLSERAVAEALESG
jgi:hypothetical protein